MRLRQGMVANPAVLFHHNFLSLLLPVSVVPVFQRVSLVTLCVTLNIPRELR
uniref:Uncharacterized protein n=1 Tax=Octopus bimaculoides TaxID=37653 RepID=A0A0L8H1P9_OCTBM